MLGQQHRGVSVISLIATLREEARLPIALIQRYLRTVHQLHLSVGAIHQTARHAQLVVARIVDRIRASSYEPLTNHHADETGWRQDGSNGYVWTFSTPTDTSCGGTGVRPRWTRLSTPALPASWSAISTLPTTITSAPYNAAGSSCPASIILAGRIAANECY